MTQTIDLSKSNKGQFQIQNPTDQAIPILLKAKERIQLADGTEKLPDTKLINIFPPQIIVPPKDKRTIKVSWTGNEKISAEKSFRVIAEQVPLNVGEKKESGIKMLLKYQAALYVDNGKTKSDLKLKDFKQNKKLTIVLENVGNKHKYLKNLKIYFKKKNKTLELPLEELKTLEGQNILAKTLRKFKFTPIKGLDSSYKGYITFE